MTTEEAPADRPTLSDRVSSARKETLEWTQRQLEDVFFAPDDRWKLHPYVKPQASALVQGEEACRALTVGKHADHSQIESTFHTVAFGKYNGRNACLIIVELRFVYNKDKLINRALVRLNFGTENMDKAASKSVSPNDRLAKKIGHSQVKVLSKTNLVLGSQDLIASYPRGTNVFGPMDSYGEIKTRQEEQEYGWSVGKQLQVAEVEAKTKNTVTKEDSWHAQGIKDSDRPCYTWSFYGNEYDARNNFPRKFMVGAVVEYDEVDFYCDVTIAGRRTKHSDWCVNIDRKTCQPVPNSNGLLTEGMLRSITESTNMQVEPVKASAAAIGDEATPAVQTTTVHVEHLNLVQNLVQHQNVAVLPSGEAVAAPAPQPTITAQPRQLEPAMEEGRVEPEGASSPHSGPAA